MIFRLAIVIVILTSVVSAQTACTAANPCVDVQVSGTTGGTATLLKCGGTCTTASLNAYLASPGSQSVWSVVGTFPQGVATVDYYDPEAYGLQLSYAAYETPSGGSAGPVSGIVTFQMPSPPLTAPTLTIPRIVISGTAGPQ